MNIMDYNKRQKMCFSEEETYYSLSNLNQLIDSTKPIVDISLNEAEKYYESVLNGLEKEIRMYEDKLEQQLLTNKSLNQNLTNMDKEKQRIVLEFQQFFRTLSANLKLVNQLEEELQNVKDFLGNTTKFEKDVQLTEQECSFRYDQVVKMYENILEEFTHIEKTYAQKMKDLKEYVNIALSQKLNKREIHENISEELKKYTKLCRDEQALLDTKLQSLQEYFLQANINDDELVKLELELSKATEKYHHRASQGKFETASLRQEIGFLKDRTAWQIASKDSKINNLLSRIQELNTKVDEVRKAIDIHMQSIEALERVLEEKSKTCHDMEVEIKNLNHEIKVETDLKLQNKCKIKNARATLKILIDNMQHSLQKEIEVQETKNKTFSKEVEKRQTIDTCENRLLKLSEQLTVVGSEIEPLEGILATVKSKTDEVKSLINNLERRIQEIIEEKLNALPGTFNGSKVSELNEEIKEYNNILETLLILKGEQTSLDNTVQHEYSSLCRKVLELLSKATDLQMNAEQVQKENILLETTIREKEKTCQVVTKEKNDDKYSIETLKRSVKEGRYITQSELNKKIIIMANAKCKEMKKCQLVQEEINVLILKLNKLQVFNTIDIQKSHSGQPALSNYSLPQ